MKIDELIQLCEAQYVRGHDHIQLVAKSFPRAGFPRGVLLCENPNGEKVKMFKVKAVLKALRKVRDDAERTS